MCAQAGTLFECSIHTGTPAALLRAYAEDTGEAILPPKWAFGPWMSSNGWNTQKEALEQLAKMHETAIPATVMVLEAWSDEETFYGRSQSSNMRPRRTACSSILTGNMRKSTASA